MNRGHQDVQGGAPENVVEKSYNLDKNNKCSLFFSTEDPNNLEGRGLATGSITPVPANTPKITTDNEYEQLPFFQEQIGPEGIYGKQYMTPVQKKMIANIKPKNDNDELIK